MIFASPVQRVENERLRDENEAIQDENAKLRDEVERLRSVVSDGADNAREVLAENAKLRELVADLWTHCPADRYYCALCEYGNDDGSECKLADRMRELGVEVD